MDWLRNTYKSFRSSEGPPYNEDLESLKDYKTRWMSIRIIYFTMFLMSLGFSIVLTGIWPYLDKLDSSAGKEFMGYVVGANPLGQMLFSPLVGHWGNKLGSIRLPLLCSLVMFTLASAAYSSLEAFPSYNVKYWMIASRFFVGVSSANIAVCRSYLSAATTIKERTGAVSMVSLAQVLGFIVGPGLQAAVTPLGSHGVDFISGYLTMNMYTAAGWINVIMGIGNFILFLPAFFQEKKVAAREVMIMQGQETERDAWEAVTPDYGTAWTLLVAFFVLVFNFVLLETLGTSLTMDQFAWTKTEALYYMGILMSVGAIIACLTFIGIEPLCKRFAEQKVLVWGGFSLMVIGRFLYIPWGDEPPKIAEIYNETRFKNDTNLTDFLETDERFLGCPEIQTWCFYTPKLTITQFIIGYAFTAIGYPIGVTLIQTIFSKILGPRPQGVWMGLLTGSGCLSRVMGPIFVSYIYTRFGTYYTFGLTAIMMLVSMIWLWIFNDRLIPPNLEADKTIEMDALNKEKENSDENVTEIF